MSLLAGDTTENCAVRKCSATSTATKQNRSAADGADGWIIAFYYTQKATGCREPGTGGTEKQQDDTSNDQINVQYPPAVDDADHNHDVTQCHIRSFALRIKGDILIERCERDNHNKVVRSNMCPLKHYKIDRDESPHNVQVVPLSRCPFPRLDTRLGLQNET